MLLMIYMTHVWRNSALDGAAIVVYELINFTLLVYIRTEDGTHLFTRVPGIDWSVGLLIKKTKMRSKFVFIFFQSNQLSLLCTYVLAPSVLCSYPCSSVPRNPTCRCRNLPENLEDRQAASEKMHKIASYISRNAYKRGKNCINCVL